jgi:hypothetical protein
MPSPFFKNKTNNPAPEDFSLYEPPQADPVRITSAEPLTVPAISPGDVDVIQDPAGNLVRIQLTPNRTNRSGRQDVDLTDRGSSNLSVSQDAPEENYFEEGDFELGSNYSLTDDGSETGSPLGLNASRKSKTKISGAKDATALNQGPFMEDLSKIQINPRPNELNRFSSMTYNIALYIMNSKSYVNMLTQPRTPQVALSPPNSYLLMRSGGVGLDGGGTDFSNDFFIDDLEISNVAVGPNKFKANTNATDIRFTITEPRGVTLLERLQRVAGTVLASTREKYIHAPYLLEITFKGYDENGTPLPTSSAAKYIPIRLIDMQFDVTASGTQYKVQAIPFANHAMGSIMSTIPFNVELKASTVGDIFSAGVIVEETVQTTETVRINPRETTTRERIVKKKKKSQAKNLAEILTDYQKKRTLESTTLVDKNFEVKEQPVPPAAEKYDTYKFLIAQNIASAKLNLTGLYDALNTPAPTEDSKEKTDKTKSDKRQFDAYVRGISQGITLDKETQTFKINAGTDITKLLNLVILHSDYMDQNIVDNPSQQVSEGGGIDWFKIRPIIESAESVGGGMDNKDGRYKYLITYAVEPNKIYYSDFPWAKKSKPTGIGVHKKYDYIFSGTNTEVLDFDLKFRTAFIQVMTAGTGAPFGSKTADEHFAGIVKELPQSAEGNTINSQDGMKRARAKDLFSSVMSDGVDMIDLNLQIIGDPAFIPTSDAYWQDKVRAGQQYTEAFMPDGSINYNLTPPFVQVNLKTPVDYNETSGLANPNRYGNSSFSGVYQVTSVDSTFSGGRFEQRINGFRAMLQPTSSGVARSEAQTAGKERTAFAKEAANSFAGGNLLGEFDTKPKTNSGVATVVDTAASEDAYNYEDTPYTSPTVNNARTQQIARDQQDRTVPTITDNDPTQSEAWASRYTAYPDGAI